MKRQYSAGASGGTCDACPPVEFPVPFVAPVAAALIAPVPVVIPVAPVAPLVDDGFGSCVLFRSAHGSPQSTPPVLSMRNRFTSALTSSVWAHGTTMSLPQQSS